MIRQLICRTAPLVALAAIAQPAAAAEIQMTVANPVIELTMNETVNADPDVVIISAGVTTVALTAVDAMRQNSAQMDRVIAEIEAQGVDLDDIQTSGINLNAEYEWAEDTREQRFRGYRVMNSVSVKLRDIARTGRVLDALVAAGATDLGGIMWSIDDPAPAQDKAREAAIAGAQKRAVAYARMAGYQNVRVLEINETLTGGNGGFGDMVVVATAARSESVPVQPGQVLVGVNVTVKYEMVN